MKDKIMSLVEVDTISRNLDMLESRLGYQVPRHLLNSDDLSKEIMSLEEVDTTARNIDLINMRRGYNYSSDSNLPDWIEYWPLWLAAVVVILVIIQSITGIF